jgi:predicted nucleic acid-binding protein
VSFLLDTNVISEARKPNGDPNVKFPITADIADEWGRLNIPDPVPVVDGLIAATARVRGLTLVTRNSVRPGPHRRAALEPV